MTTHTDHEPPATIEAPRVIPRTEAEWQKLLDVRLAEAKKMQADARAARKQGKKELAKDYTKKAKYWQDHFISPLENNVELARHAPSGTHADSYYDASQWTLARMLDKTDTAPSRIMRVGASATPTKNADTTGSGEGSQAHTPAPVADNNPAKTETAVDTNDNVSSPVRTIDNSGESAKYTKFIVGDLLRIPAHYRKEGYPVAAIKVERNTVRYGFAVASWDSSLLHWYSEDALVDLNAHKVKPALEQPVQVDEVPEVTDMKAKIELMEQSLRCVIEAFFAGDLPGIETCFHEFQHDLYRATKRNPSLMTEVKASILMRLQMREPVELPEPVDNSKQKALPNFGESEAAA